MKMALCFCLPGIMENSVNCHGNVIEFYYRISAGILFLGVASTIQSVADFIVE